MKTTFQHELDCDNQKENKTTQILPPDPISIHQQSKRINLNEYKLRWCLEPSVQEPNPENGSRKKQLKDGCQYGTIVPSSHMN